MYAIEFSEEATKELLKMMKSDVQAYKKFESLIPELREHPYTGTGHPHQLRHVNGIWSRKLDKKNRLRYTVNDTTVIVLSCRLWDIMMTSRGFDILSLPLGVRVCQTDDN